MGAFSIYSDAPNLIVDEGRTITITLNRTSPTTATLTWNLPIPTPIPPDTYTYNGIVITMDTKEMGIDHVPVNPPIPNQGLPRPLPLNGVPVNGVHYVGDPTADVNLFAGDKIGTAFVVGAFYNDITTVTLNITGLQPNLSYYFAGFAVNNILEYHQEGVHTYTLTYGEQPGPPASPGFQFISLNVQPFDLTGLHVGTTYQVPLAINKLLRNPNNAAHGLDEFGDIIYAGGQVVPCLDSQNIINVVLGENDIDRPHESRTPNYIFIFDGEVALTWEAFVAELNRQFSLIGNPAQGVDPPNTGSYYYNPTTGQLYQWNGYTLIQLTYISDPIAPTMPNVGDYWVNTTTQQLFQWNGTTWILKDSIALPTDPAGPLVPALGDYWVSIPSNELYRWDGTMWALLNVTASSTPPPSPVLASYWFNTVTSILSQWNGSIWVPLPSIVQPPVPVGSTTTPPVTGAYWYNTTDSKLFQWTGTIWTQINSTSSPTAPVAPATGDYWFNTTDDLLYRWNSTIWVLLPALVLPPEPVGMSVTNIFPCDTVWFNGTTAYIWDGTVWIPLATYIQTTDPEAAPILTCGSYWFNTTNNTLYKWVDVTGTCANGVGLANGNWKPISPILWSVDPTATLAIGDYWFDLKNNLLKSWNGVTWDTITTADITDVEPINPAINELWFNPDTEILQQWNGTVWNTLPVRVWDKDPANPPAGSVWWNTTNNKLYERDTLNNTWVEVVNFYDQTTDPAQPLDFPQNGAVWFDPVTGVMKLWDGSQWVVTPFITYPTPPTMIADGSYWHNTATNLWYIRSGGVWVQINPVLYPTQPTTPSAGEYWIDSSGQLYQWNGSGWVLLSYTTTNPAPKVGTMWYNTTTNQLMEWNGTTWVIATPIATAALVPHEPCNLFPYTVTPPPPFTPYPVQRVYNLLIYTGRRDATANIYIVPPSTNPTSEPFYVFDGNQLLVAACLERPFSGSDAPPHYPQYNDVGIGTSGDPANRRAMVENVFLALGYPSVQVELTKANVEFAVDMALKELRRLGSSAYERKFFFLNLFPNKQRYVLTDISQQFNTIHRVTAVNRRTSSFLGQAEGQGVYGQLVLQHLYQMGTFDLVSYHIVSDYSKMMEILFASRVMYLWNEKNHTLDIFQTLSQPETVLIDCACERTEQDIFADRFLNTWLLNWAVAEAELILAGNRGKFQTLPGAGGGIALNAQDLRNDAALRKDRCLQEINDYIANSNLEEWGMTAEFTFG
jgi:hypothetical protein